MNCFLIRIQAPHHFIWFAVIIGIFCMSTLLSAQPTQWISLKGPLYGTPHRLVQHPSGVIIAQSYWRTLYRSTDDGRNWQATPMPATPKELVQTANGTLFIATDQGVFRSEDAGTRWEPVGLQDQDVETIALYEGHGNLVLYAVSQNQIYRSDNGSQPWQITNSAHLFDDRAQVRSLVALSEKVVLASELYNVDLNDGVHRSDDGGQTWAKTDFAGTGLNLFMQAVPGTEEVYLGTRASMFSSEDGLFYSADGGLDWEKVLDEPTLGISFETDSVVAGTTTGLHRAKIGEHAWTRGELGDQVVSTSLRTRRGSMLVAGFVLCQEVIDPPIPCRGISGVLRKEPGKPYIQTGIRTDWVNALIFDVDGTLLAGTDNGVIRLTEAGWQPTGWNHGAVKDFEPVGDRIWVGASTLNNPQQSFSGCCWYGDIVQDASNNLYVTAHFSSIIFFSPALGQTWERRLQHRYYISSLFVSKDNTLYASTSDGVYRTEDTGLTWTHSDSGLIDINTGAVSTVVDLNEDEADVLLAGTFNGLYQSLDNGQTWQPAGLDSMIVWAIERSSNYDLVAATSDGVYVRLQGQPEWIRANEGLEGHIVNAITFDEHNRVYVGTQQGGVFRSVRPVVISIEADVAGVPTETMLLSNYPNPFTDETTISYTLHEPGNARLMIYDLLGREVQLLDSGFRPLGEHEVVWSTSGVPAGIYLAVLQTGQQHFIHKLIHTQ